MQELPSQQHPSQPSDGPTSREAARSAKSTWKIRNSVVEPSEAGASPVTSVPYNAGYANFTRESSQLSTVPPTTTFNDNSAGPQGYFGDSSTVALVSKLRCDCQDDMGVHLQNDPDNDVLGAQGSCKIHATRSSKRGLIDLYLPERNLADNLIDKYFERFHPLYPFLHEGSFRDEYEKMWCELPNTPLRCSWYAVLNAVFAQACEFCDLVPDAKFASTVAPFVDRTRESILSHIYQQANLEFVQALLLLCHYLQGTIKLNECWNLVGLMIRTAVSIGLHVDPDQLPLSVLEKELRKRVWWGCFTIDQTLGWKFGRPRALQVADAQAVPFPSLVDDQYIHCRSSVVRQPAERPPYVAFFRYTIELSKIIEKVLHQLYAPNKKNSAPLDLGAKSSDILSTVVQLDSELQTWWEEMPMHLRPDSTDDEARIFRRQRSVMEIRQVMAALL